ncbi:unnamed protein product [Lampetra fluviatilis]
MVGGRDTVVGRDARQRKRELQCNASPLCRSIGALRPTPPPVVVSVTGRDSTWRHDGVTYGAVCLVRVSTPTRRYDPSPPCPTAKGPKFH